MSIAALRIEQYVAAFPGSPLRRWASAPPWELTVESVAVVRQLFSSLPAAEYIIADEVACHRSVTVESGAVLKGPLILGPHCFVAAGAYLRGGNWVAERCTFGPGAELKSSFVFPRTKLAHFNFVGDSILGSEVNLEAGSIVCNYRNERANKEIRVRVGSALHPTGSTKFGALIGDRSRVGANAVLAPGTILQAESVVARLALVDQEASGAAAGG